MRQRRAWLLGGLPEGCEWLVLVGNDEGNDEEGKEEEGKDEQEAYISSAE